MSRCSVELTLGLFEDQLLAASVVIPARWGSTRFPAKILASSTGRPLVQHVVDRVRECRKVRQIIVATDDCRIVEALERFGTTAVMTSPKHSSGTDRIAEVAESLEDEIIVNVQGDEPEIEPSVVDGLIQCMENAPHDMATAATPFPVDADPSDPNLVKVVVDQNGRALYFSRACIPFPRDPSVGGVMHHLHLGVYAYRRRFLLEFASWPAGVLESIEKLEQLRALEHGRSIFVLPVAHATHGIDTPEQYERFVRRYQRITDQGRPL